MAVDYGSVVQEQYQIVGGIQAHIVSLGKRDGGAGCGELQEWLKTLALAVDKLATLEGLRPGGSRHPDEQTVRVEITGDAQDVARAMARQAGRKARQ